MSLLNKVGAAILEHAPEAFPAIARTLAAQGIDLGPMTPNAKKHFGDVNRRIAEKLDERSELDRAHRPIPDPDPTPRPSGR